MLSFKARTNITNMHGKRVKRRIGKAEQIRAYYCQHCKGYHLTSMKDYASVPSHRKFLKERSKGRQDFLKTQEEIDDWKSDSLPFPETDSSL